jgi:hypothetical protein
MKNQQAKQEVGSFVENFVIDLARGTVGIMELLVQESRERERAERERKRLCAVAMINNAVKDGRRITRDELAVFYRNSHMSVKQLAEALEVPVPRLKKALKRWYHFF